MREEYTRPRFPCKLRYSPAAERITSGTQPSARLSVMVCSIDYLLSLFIPQNSRRFFLILSPRPVFCQEQQQEKRKQSLAPTEAQLASKPPSSTSPSTTDSSPSPTFRPQQQQQQKQQPGLALESREHSEVMRIPALSGSSSVSLMSPPTVETTGSTLFAEIAKSNNADASIMSGAMKAMADGGRNELMEAKDGVDPAVRIRGILGGGLGLGADTNSEVVGSTRPSEILDTIEKDVAIGSRGGVRDGDKRSPAGTAKSLNPATFTGQDYDELGSMNSEWSSDGEDYEEEGGAKDMVKKALELACNGSTHKNKKYTSSTDELDLSVSPFSPVSASWHCPYSELLSCFSFICFC